MFPGITSCVQAKREFSIWRSEYIGGEPAILHEFIRRKWCYLEDVRRAMDQVQCSGCEKLIYHEATCDLCDEPICDECGENGVDLVHDDGCEGVLYEDENCSCGYTDIWMCKGGHGAGEDEEASERRQMGLVNF